MKKIGVTGGKGFIGKHLVSALQASRLGEVIPFDARFEQDDALFQFVKHCDVIYHLAGINRSADENVVTGNIMMMFRLLRAASQQNKWIIFTSSRQEGTPYALAKLTCEEMLKDSAGKSNLCATTLRLPNIYGPGCKPFYNSVVATFAHLVAEGKNFSELPIHGDGMQMREYLYVGELVRKLVDLQFVKSPKPFDYMVLEGQALRVKEIGEIFTQPEKLEENPYFHQTLLSYQNA